MSDRQFRPSSLRSRLLAAIWFGLFGITAALLLYLVPSRGRIIPLSLFCGLPGVAAAFSGALLGHRILNQRYVSKGASAAVHGLIVTLLSYLIYAPLLSIVYSLTDRFEATVNVLGMTVAVILGGPLFTGLVVLPIGALAGYLLFRLWGKRCVDIS